MPDDALHIRSFRVVFDLERRIHRIDRYRIPLPYGLPLRSIGYAAVALLFVVAIERLPVAGTLLNGLPAPARYVLVPAAASYALTQLRMDGRSAHRAAAAWLRFAIGPRSMIAFRPLPSRERVELSQFTCAVGPPHARTERPPTHASGDSRKPQLELVDRDQLELL